MPTQGAMASVGGLVWPHVGDWAQPFRAFKSIVNCTAFTICQGLPSGWGDDHQSDVMPSDMSSGTVSRTLSVDRKRSKGTWEFVRLCCPCFYYLGSRVWVFQWRLSIMQDTTTHGIRNAGRLKGQSAASLSTRCGLPKAVTPA